MASRLRCCTLGVRYGSGSTLIDPPAARPPFCVRRRCKANIDLAACPIQLRPMFAPCRPKKTAFRGRRFHEGCPQSISTFKMSCRLCEQVGNDFSSDEQPVAATPSFPRGTGQALFLSSFLVFFLDLWTGAYMLHTARLPEKRRFRTDRQDVCPGDNARARHEIRLSNHKPLHSLEDCLL